MGGGGWELRGGTKVNPFGLCVLGEVGMVGLTEVIYHEKTVLLILLCNMI